METINTDLNIQRSLEVQQNLQLNGSGYVYGSLEVSSTLKTKSLQVTSSTLTINENKVGIGTTTPQSALEVRGNITTKWGLTFEHYEQQWGTHAKRTWLRKAWNGHIGDYLLISSTGNRSNEVQSSMILAEKGIYFGRGTNNGEGLSKEWLNINDQGALSFGSQTRQMINLWRDEYAIGVQGYTAYSRTAHNFAWYLKGKHDNNRFSAGSGGKQLMTLDEAGRLTVGDRTNAGTMSIEATSPSLWGKPSIGGTYNKDHWAYLHVSKPHSLIWDAKTSMRFGVEARKGSGYAELMRITQAGNLGIGTTNPAVKLHVNGNRIRVSKNANHYIDIRADGSALDIESSKDLYLNNNGNKVFYRNMSRVSSRKFKKAIESLSVEFVAPLLEALRPVQYKYNNDKDKRPKLGFIAEEMPSPIAAEDKMSVDTMDIIAILCKMVQHHQKILTQWQN